MPWWHVCIRDYLLRGPISTAMLKLLWIHYALVECRFKRSEHRYYIQDQQQTLQNDLGCQIYKSIMSQKKLQTSKVFWKWRVFCIITQIRYTVDKIYGSKCLQNNFVSLSTLPTAGNVLFCVNLLSSSDLGNTNWLGFFFENLNDILRAF